MAPPLRCGCLIIVSIIPILPLTSGSTVLTIITASAIRRTAARVSFTLAMLTIVCNRSRLTLATASCWFFKQWGRLGQWTTSSSHRGTLNPLSRFWLGRLWGLRWWGLWKWWGWWKRGWLPRRGECTLWVHLEECLGVGKHMKGAIFHVNN